MSSFDTVIPDDITLSKMQEVKQHFCAIENIYLALKDSRLKLLALSELEISHMLYVKALEFAQVERNTAFLVNTPAVAVAPMPSSDPVQVLSESNAKMEQLKKEVAKLLANSGMKQ